MLRRIKKKRRKRRTDLKLSKDDILYEIEIHMKLHMCVCTTVVIQDMCLSVEIYFDLLSFVFNIECSSNIAIVISQGCMFSNSAYGILPVNLKIKRK